MGQRVARFNPLDGSYVDAIPEKATQADDLLDINPATAYQQNDRPGIREADTEKILTGRPYQTSPRFGRRARKAERVEASGPQASRPDPWL